jgi:hypothetical protein
MYIYVYLLIRICICLYIHIYGSIMIQIQLVMLKNFLKNVTFKMLRGDYICVCIYMYDIYFSDVIYVLLLIALYVCMYRKSIDEVLDRGSNMNNSQELSIIYICYLISFIYIIIILLTYICIYIDIYIYRYIYIHIFVCTGRAQMKY